MPSFKVQTPDLETRQKVEEVFEQTRILQRQIELEPGRWSFVVFGAQGKEHTIIREGCAVHLRIHDSLVYIATVGDPGEVGERGMPIEEFAQEEISPDLRGLEIYQVDPFRPLTIYEKRKGPSPAIASETIVEEFRDKNTAIIETPDERYWSLSVLKYLNECDRFFPDVLTEAIRKGSLPLKGYFSPPFTKFH